MLRDRLLSLAGGFGFGAAITLSILIDSVPKDLLSTIFIGIALGVAVGVILTMTFFDYFQSVQTGQDQRTKCVVKCTCQDPAKMHCKKHDPNMLMNVATNIPNYCMMTQLGSELGISANIIEAFRNGNTNIDQAVYEMLYQWYRGLEESDQDGLDWKEKLRKALREINSGNLVDRPVIER